MNESTSDKPAPQKSAPSKPAHVPEPEAVAAKSVQVSKLEPVASKTGKLVESDLEPSKPTLLVESSRALEPMTQPVYRVPPLRVRHLNSWSLVEPDSVIPRWPEPPPAQSWMLGAAAMAGLLAALLIPGSERLGINLVICALAVVVPVGLQAYRYGRQQSERRRPVGLVTIATVAVALGLTAVAAVRASPPLVLGCLAAALCLGAAAVLDVRRLREVLSTVALFGYAVVRSLGWAGRSLPRGKPRAITQPVVNGVVVGVICAAVVAALLASADAAFAEVLMNLWPSFDLGLLPVRVLFFVVAVGLALGALFAVSTRLRLPAPKRKRPARIASAPATADAGHHPAEWMTPLVLVGLTIAAFLLVEATTLFGGVEVVVDAEVLLTHADRAREGFGQLTVVTMIVLVLLTWAGNRAEEGPPRHRRLMGLVGGALLVLALLLAASALRRLWLYQDVYGFTVARVNAGAFELWLFTVLLAVGAFWWLRRTDLLARFVVGSAGLGLLLVSLAGPDAIVAEASVDRFASTGKLDHYYLSTLSADAVPALDRLPEPERSCALGDRELPQVDPWYVWNVSRWRAEQVLIERPVLSCQK